MTPVDVAWAAGFFDGEGCVHIHKDQHRYDTNLASYKLTASVSGRNRAALDRFAELFGGRVRLSPKRAYPGVPFFQLQLNTESASAALKAMLPYLTNKHDVAALAVEFQDWYAASRTRSRAMPEARRARAEVYKAECHRIVRLHRQPQGSKVSSPSIEEAARRAG